MNDRPVPPREAMRVCAEIAAALAAAHAEGLAHRDIKPANVMLAPTGAKVVDFGIAAVIRAPASGTADFEVLGTPAYLAPEPLPPMSQVPGPVTALCNRCLAKDPAERPSAGEAAALLAHNAGLPVLTDEPPAPGPSVVIRRSPATTRLSSPAPPPLSRRSARARPGPR